MCLFRFHDPELVWAVYGPLTVTGPRVGDALDALGGPEVLGLGGTEVAMIPVGAHSTSGTADRQRQPSSGAT